MKTNQYNIEDETTKKHWAMDFVSRALAAGGASTAFFVLLNSAETHAK
jgi:hypothetical protein